MKPETLGGIVGVVIVAYHLFLAVDVVRVSEDPVQIEEEVSQEHPPFVAA